MFHPVGSQPPSVYWRRRFILIASVVLLIVLLAVTIEVATSGSGSTPTGAATTAPVNSRAATPTHTTPAHPHTSATRTSPPATHSSTPTAPVSKPGTKSTSRSVAPVACTSSGIAVQAVAAQPSYQVGDEPMLELQVTNTGSLPCIEDLSDKQIVLKVYNGESRVWGSHDCKVEPGSNEQTLAVNSPVRVSLTWTGLASKPGECNNRQRVGAGTYTLYATLAGKTGKATQFSIS